MEGCFYTILTCEQFLRFYYTTLFGTSKHSVIRRILDAANFERFILLYTIFDEPTIHK